MNDVVDTMKGLDLRSLAIGFASGLTVALGLVVAWKVTKLAVKLAIIAAIIALVGGGYLSAR